MHRFITPTVALLAAFLVLSITVPSVMAADELDYKAWREAIPDYDRRLYNRVKTIAEREVTITRLVVANIAISILAILISIRSSRRRAMAADELMALREIVCKVETTNIALERMVEAARRKDSEAH